MLAQLLCTCSSFQKMDSTQKQFIKEQIACLKTDKTKHAVVIEPKENNYGLLLWDPITQLDKALVCPLHNLALDVTDHWTQGENERHKPRILYNLGRNVLLVSRLYKCGLCKENYRSHNEGLSAQLGHTLIPYILLHRSGFTMKTFDLTISMIETGKSIIDIISVWL
jgi:hypothetical protein